MEHRKIILIGLDGLMPEQVDRYRDHVPELRRLLNQGFFSPAIPSAVTDTPTNWTTIATGARMGTHGIVGFNDHLPGMSAGETAPAFNSRLCQAEYFWQAAERQGKRSILINYPTAFPLTLRDGVVVGGDGLFSRDWTVRYPEYISSFRRVPGGKRLILVPARGWKGVPPSWKVICEGVVDLEDQVRFGWDAAGVTDEGMTDQPGAERRYAMVFRENNRTRVALAPKRDVRKAIAIIGKGEWSGWVGERFLGKRCLRQYKVLDLSPDGKRISIYGSMAGCLRGWGYPKGIEDEIISNAGAYVEALELSPDSAFRGGWFEGHELDAVMDIMEIQARWTSDCAAYLNSTQAWDVMFIQYHAPDGINHDVLGWLQLPDRKKRRVADDLMLATMRIMFRMVDRVRKECADENTVLCVVSDHGNIPVSRWINVHRILEEEGWEVFKQDRRTGTWALDPRRTLAWNAGHASGIWINLKGRERFGRVKPGEEYEGLREEITERLHRVIDPETGKGVFDLVVTREQMEPLGVWGERVPDLFCYAKPDYLFYGAGDNDIPDAVMQFYRERPEIIPLSDLEHARYISTLSAVHWHLPNASVGYASNRAMCMLTGPGILRNHRGHRINLADVSVTLAHLLGIDPPAQSEGRVIREALKSR
jgi:predicted AlkP superfamily phosphohydrolase/phosphomutase